MHLKSVYINTLFMYTYGGRNKELINLGPDANQLMMENCRFPSRNQHYLMQHYILG